MPEKKSFLSAFLVKILEFRKKQLSNIRKYGLSNRKQKAIVIDMKTGMPEKENNEKWKPKEEL
ncbi:MAG: hypothetical protein KKA70_10680 [Proteobacteria bacterium]|nr:hypothetical protein [Pseudomonadota bacterium]